MTKYRVELRRQVRQVAQLYVDKKSVERAEQYALGLVDSNHSNAAIWHDLSVVKNTLEATAQKSEDVDRRDKDWRYDRDAEDERRKRDAAEGFDE